MFKYETHMHTAESSVCGRVKAAEQVRLYKDRGYTGIIITDHLRSDGLSFGALKKMKSPFSWEQKVDVLLKGYEKAKAEGDKIGLDVFLGWEFYDKGWEFLTYGLDKEFLLKNKDIDKMPIEEYSELVRKNGGYLAQAHPYRAKEDKCAPIPSNYVDAYEVFNGNRIHVKDENKKYENQKAWEYANSCNHPMQAGSDAHRTELRFYTGVMLEEKADSVFDIINAIKSKKVELILPKEMPLDIEPASPLLVRIFYDSKRAKEIAQELCHYIQDWMEIDAICYSDEDAGKIDATATVVKTIYIGHHSRTKDKLKYMDTIPYDEYGMKYGCNKNTAVLAVSQKGFQKSKSLWNKFVVDYCKRFDENPENLPVHEAQFKYITTEFMQTYLEEFVNL